MKNERLDDVDVVRIEGNRVTVMGKIYRWPRYLAGWRGKKIECFEIVCSKDTGNIFSERFYPSKYANRNDPYVERCNELMAANQMDKPLLTIIDAVRIDNGRVTVLHRKVIEMRREDLEDHSLFHGTDMRFKSVCDMSTGRLLQEIEYERFPSGLNGRYNGDVRAINEANHDEFVKSLEHIAIYQCSASELEKHLGKKVEMIPLSGQKRFIEQESRLAMLEEAGNLQADAIVNYQTYSPRSRGVSLSLAFSWGSDYPGDAPVPSMHMGTPVRILEEEK